MSDQRLNYLEQVMSGAIPPSTEDALDHFQFNDLDEEIEDYLQWLETAKSERLCPFCNNNLFINADSYKDLVLNCINCPYKYNEVSYMYSFYGFTIDKYRIHACISEDYGEDSSDPSTLQITINGDYENQIKHRIIVQPKYWVGSKDEILDKIKTFLVFK